MVVVAVICSPSGITARSDPNPLVLLAKAVYPAAMPHNRLKRHLTGHVAFFCLLIACLAHAETEDCANCHEAEALAWQGSHHAAAMALATQSSTSGKQINATAVLGDFDNAQATHKGLRANFLTVDGQPVMTLTRGDKTTRHVVSESFGHEPLQQYLTETEAGYRQVLPFSWDARDAQEGGQRWITLYPAEDIKPADRLHWQQPLANWNGMCADCHSTGLVRNFSIDDAAPATSADTPTSVARFDTAYSAVNVSCGSCHGDTPHETNPIAKGSSAGFAPRYPLSKTLPTKILNGEEKAQQRERSKKTLEVCAGCHSLRSPLTDGINPELAFLDQFTPTLPNPTLYFADGQIREEVYVWGSFLQSRMHQEGVTCGNCHEPHSQKLRAEGNALCGQCHLAEQYDVPDHHQHSIDSSGAACVNCHMNSRTYMVVDDRRDHSFRVPNLPASQLLDTPDPCTTCHQGKTQSWASAAIAKWPKRKTAKEQTQHPTVTLGANLNPVQHSALIANGAVPEILRAASLTPQALASYGQGASAKLLQQAVARPEPLIALAALQSAGHLSPADRSAIIAPLLTHQFRALRIAAVNQLRDLPAAAAPRKSSAFTKALAEADEATDISSWRGEGLLNKAIHAERGGRVADAIENYRRSIALDPYFEPGYINLTDLYRRQGDVRREQLLYTQALRTLPRSALLRYSYALHLVRRKDTENAVKQTELALNIDPRNANAAYLHLLLLDNLGQTRDAVAWTNAHLEQQSKSPQVLQIAAKLAQKVGDQGSYTRFSKALTHALPPTTENPSR